MKAYFKQAMLIDGHKYNLGNNDVKSGHDRHWYFKTCVKAGYIIPDILTKIEQEPVESEQEPVESEQEPVKPKPKQAKKKAVKKR